MPSAWRETVERVVRQRLAAHARPDAVADALEVVSHSRPFEGLEELAHIAAPAVVVASRDEVDPGHPLALAERYTAAIPAATLTVEDGGPPARSPIAWQGGQLSKVLVELLAGARWDSSSLCVITYRCMPEVRQWDGQSYDRISGPMEALGLAVLDRLRSMVTRPCSTPAAAPVGSPKR